MVEIIRKGSLPEERVHKATCNNCDTLFSFKESEAAQSYDQRDGRTFSISCSLCKQICYVPSEKVTRMPWRYDGPQLG